MSFKGSGTLRHIAFLMFISAMMGGVFPLIKVADDRRADLWSRLSVRKY